MRHSSVPATSVSANGPSVPLTSMEHAGFIAVTLLYWTSLYIYVPLLSPYVESLGASLAFVGIVLGSYGFIQLLVRLPLGILSDRMRVRKPFIALGMATAALSCIMFAATQQLGWTLAARAVSGVSASCWVAFTVLYASYYAKHEATKAMGVISFLTVAGQLIGMGLSGILSHWTGTSSVFWTGAAVGVAGLAATFFVKEPKEGVYREPIRMKDLAPVMKESSLLKASLLSVLAHCVLFITMFGFTPSYAATLHADDLDLSLLSIAFMVPHAFASLYSGKRFAPRWGAWNVILTGFALSAICTAAIPFMPTLGLLMATQAVNGLAQGLHMPLLMGMAIQSVEQDKRATAMGFYQAVYSAGMFGGPFIAGWLNDSVGLVGGFWFGTAAALLACVILFYTKNS